MLSLPCLRRLLLLVSLAALSHSALARSDGLLTIGMSQFPGELHPFTISSGAKATVLGAVRRGLFAFDPAGSLSCHLCTELPTLANGRLHMEPDGTEDVTITLRADQAYADGTPLTAADMLRGLAEAHAFGTVPATTSAAASDALTIRYHFATATSDLGRAIPDPYPAKLDTDAPISSVERLQQATFSRAPETPGLWNGPYRIAEYRRDELIALVPNEHWSGPPVAFRRVELRLIANTAALRVNLLSGDIDIPSAEIGLSFDQALQISQSATDRFDVTFAPGEGVELMAVRIDQPLLSDPRVRRAILAAIDRDAISAKLFGGRQPVADGFLPPQLARAPGQARIPYDPTAARILLHEAGFTPGPDGILRSAAGERFSIPLATTAGNQTRELLEQVIKDQLRRVGIEVTLANVPARTLFGETLRERTFGGLVLYQFGFTPGSVPVAQFGSGQIPSRENGFRGLNYSGLSDPHMDTALDAASAALDPASLIAAWQQIQAAYAADLPSLPLLASTKAYIVPKWLAGVVPPREAGMMTLWIEDWHPR